MDMHTAISLSTGEELGRPTSWVRQKMDQSPATLQKPKGMEWWDAEGHLGLQGVGQALASPWNLSKIINLHTSLQSKSTLSPRHWPESWTPIRIAEKAHHPKADFEL